MDRQDALEILTLEEFADRMKVAETTVWKWIRNDKLRPGRHFIQIERVIRFHWCRELIDRLHEDCCAEEPEQIETAEEAPKKARRINNGECPINPNILI